MNLPLKVTIERKELYDPYVVAELSRDPIELLIEDAMAEDNISSGDDDEESIVVLSEDYGEDSDLSLKSQDVYRIAHGEDIDFSGEDDDEDVYVDAVEELEGLEWDYEFGPATYPTGPPRHANCGFSSCESGNEEEEEYEKVPFEAMDGIPLKLELQNVT